MASSNEPDSLPIELIKSYIRKNDTASLDLSKEQLKKKFYHQDERGNTFLHYVAKRNSLEMAKYFLEFEKSFDETFIKESIDKIPKKKSHKFTEDMNNSNQHQKFKYKGILYMRNLDGHLPVHLAGAFFGKHVKETSENSVLTELINADYESNKKDPFTTLLAKCYLYNLNPLQHCIMKTATASKIQKRAGICILKAVYSKDEKSKVSKRLKEIILSTEVSKQNALHYACLYGNDRVLRKMLEFLDQCDEIEKHESSLKYSYLLLSDKEKQTPVHIAAREGSENCINVIIEHLRDPTKIDKILTILNIENYSPLLMAIESGDTKCLTKILNSHSNPISMINDKEQAVQPLSVAAKKSKEIFNILINSGACNLLEKNDKGNNVLMVAAAENRLETVQFLLEQENSLDINEINHFEETAFLLAVKEGNLQIVKFLLSKKPKNYFDLQNLETSNFEDKHKILDFEAEDSYERTALHLVAMQIDEDRGDSSDFLEITKLIYESLEDYGEIRTSGILESKTSERRDSAVILRNYSSTQSAHHEDKIKVFEVLASQRDDNGNTAFHIACSRGQEDLVELLMKYDPDGKELATKNEQDQTPMMLAAANDHREVIDTIFKVQKESGLSIHIFFDLLQDQDMDGNTPLHSAAANGNEAVVERLVFYSANLLARNHNKEYPLCVAAKNGHLEICRFLIDKGTPLNRNTTSKTPLMLAAENGHDKIVKLLLEMGAEQRCPYVFLTIQF